MSMSECSLFNFFFNFLLSNIKFYIFSIEDAPHQISMRPSNGSHMCGGSIATNKHVITAAHCYYNPQRLIVVAGNKNRNLVKIKPHDNFRI